MGDVSQALNWYIREVIRLPQSDISSAVKSREWFIDQVIKEINGRTDEPTLYPGQNTLYFGSYFKGTKVAAIDEFDILVIIDSNNGVFSLNGAGIGTGLGHADPNPKYYERYKKSDGSGVSPRKLLNWLKDVVASATDKYGVEEPVQSGQAITVTIKSKDLKIDLVRQECSGITSVVKRSTTSRRATTKTDGSRRHRQRYRTPQGRSKG